MPLTHIHHSLSLSHTQMGKVEILFYNALVVFVPALLLAAFTGDLTKVHCIILIIIIITIQQYS